jgi:transposase
MFSMTRSPQCIGIDVSKATLDVALLPEQTTFRISNDASGWAELITHIAPAPPPCIVLEATGTYHNGVTAALAAAGVPAAVMNPDHTHAFIRSEGQRTKTDRVDALLLARFAQQKQPAPSPVPSQNARDFKELVACRAEFTKLLTMEQNRRQVATACSRQHHDAVIAALETERLTVEQEIAALIAADPALAARHAIVRSMPGIGPVLAPVLLAGLPELGQGAPQGLASLAGVAPHTRQSGKGKAHGTIQGGRVAICKALYQMATTAAARNPVIKAHFTQLRQRMPYKAALIACARRMLGILNAMVREGITWHETRVGQGHFLPQPA